MSQKGAKTNWHKGQERRRLNTLRERGGNSESGVGMSNQTPSPVQCY